MRLLVSCESPENQEKALRLAEELELTYLPYKGEDKKKYIDTYFFIYQPNSSYIRKGLGTPTKEIRCNFTHRSNSFSDPLLSKCLKGLPNKFNALDLTAGFGKDALEIAKHQNCNSVLLLEKEKLGREFGITILLSFDNSYATSFWGSDMSIYATTSLNFKPTSSIKCFIFLQ